MNYLIISIVSVLVGGIAAFLYHAKLANAELLAEKRLRDAVNAAANTPPAVAPVNTPLGFVPVTKPETPDAPPVP